MGYTHRKFDMCAFVGYSYVRDRIGTRKHSICIRVAEREYQVRGSCQWKWIVEDNVPSQSKRRELYRIGKREASDEGFGLDKFYIVLLLQSRINLCLTLPHHMTYRYLWLPPDGFVKIPLEQHDAVGSNACYLQINLNFSLKTFYSIQFNHYVY